MRRHAPPLAAVLLAAGPAFAHTGVGATNALGAGLAHPLSGLDHLLAMVAVGLWAGLRGGQAAWAWPLAFVGAMALGGALGFAGIGLPLVEPGIAGSVFALGLLVARAVRAPVALGAALIALFGLVHGHAHGAEAPATEGGLLYALGFLAATAALHATGLGLALGARRLAKPILVRFAGAATAAAGMAMMAGWAP